MVELSVVKVLAVQFIPSGEVIYPLLECANNKDNSLTHIIHIKTYEPGVVLNVHVIPSGEVITCVPAFEVATAINKFNSIDHVTSCQFCTTTALPVQFIPSGLVITLFPAPVQETDTKSESEGDHANPDQLLPLAAVLEVHVIAFVDVITRPFPTATNNESDDAYVRPYQLLLGDGVVCNDHVFPSGEVAICL